MLSAAMSAEGRDRRRGGAAPSPRVPNGPLPRSPQAPPKRLLFAAQISTGYEVQVQVILLAVPDRPLRSCTARIWHPCARSRSAVAPTAPCPVMSCRLAASAPSRASSAKY